MSTRTHTSNLDVNVVVATTLAEIAPLNIDIEPDELPVLVIEDGGNCEAWVLVGPFDEIRALGQQIIDQANLAENGPDEEDA